MHDPGPTNGAGVPGVAQCIDRSLTPSLAFDLHCPLGSLPLAFGTGLDTIPFAVSQSGSSVTFQSPIVSLTYTAASGVQHRLQV